jgi:two-component system KDP operon response regulator KdpE
MSPSGARILVVDDEPAILRAVRTNLSHRGYQVEVAETGRQALDAYSRFHPDLLLLDLGLPDMDGIDIIKVVRARSSTPIVVLSARETERDKVTALDLGADDYLTKPFGVEELVARIRVALRHLAKPSEGSSAIFRTGELEVDLERRLVRLAGREIRLSPTEYELLKVFVAHPGRVLTDRMLLQQVWGPEYRSEGHYLHVYVARLRKKLEVHPQSPRYLMTEPGVGYRLLIEGS